MPHTQAFAEDEVEYVFTDKDRRKKIDALFPTIDALSEAEVRDEKLPGAVVGLVVDGELVGRIVPWSRGTRCPG